jgi:hypothetical protein
VNVKTFHSTSNLAAFARTFVVFFINQTIGVVAVASTASLQAAMQGIVDSSSRAQLNQLIEAFQAAQPRNAASSMTAKADMTAPKSGKEQRIKKSKSERATGGPKRPLNSWMAFRKYYSASLALHMQKTISKVLTSWWREDPFEAKW